MNRICQRQDYEKMQKKIKESSVFLWRQDKSDHRSSKHAQILAIGIK